MLESIVLRRARTEDVEAVQLVHSAAIRGGAEGYYTPEVVEVWVEAFNPDNFPQNIQRMAFFVAELPDGRIPGFLAVNLENRELESLYVAPWAGGSGLGSFMLGYGEEVARMAGLFDLWLDASLNAASFYRRHEWEEIGRHARVRRGVEIPVIRMEKFLGT
jgi:GNAT superfamily N-acetyltransferase